MGSWSVDRGAHIQAFTFSSHDHGRLSGFVWFVWYEGGVYVCMCVCVYVYVCVCVYVYVYVDMVVRM